MSDVLYMTLKSVNVSIEGALPIIALHSNFDCNEIKLIYMERVMLTDN